MLKKLLTTSLLGVSALAIMTVNAAVPTDGNNTVKQEEPNQIKSNSTHIHHHIHHVIHHQGLLNKDKNRVKKTKTVVDKNVKPQPSQAIIQAQPVELNNGFHSGLPVGLYVSGQVGYADTHLRSKIPAEYQPSAFNNNGLAGRVALGYNINKNFAVEVGYLQLSSAKSDAILPETRPVTIKTAQNAIDVLGKASLPVTHNVNVYGKAGVAYLTTNSTIGNDLKGTATPATTDANALIGVAKHKWAPEVAVGMNYAVTSNVNVDTSFTHIQPVGSKRPGNIDFLAVGVGYTFG